MLRFLKAGLVSAGCQLIAVVIITLTVFLISSDKIMGQDTSSISSDPEAYYISFSRLLPWAYLLTAIGLTLTVDRTVILTAKRMRDAARVVSPEHGSRTLAVQLVISAIILALLALRTPPETLIEIGRYYGCACAALVVWPSMMSVGVAGLGASAHAAVRAL